MFYCNECAEKNGYPESIRKSVGNCELCGKHANCNDIPSSELPLPKEQKVDTNKFQANEMNLTYTPEMVEDIKNMKGFDYETHDVQIEELIKKEAIENLAWQVFQDKTGLRFRRELTAEEKKSITDVEEYQKYREQATRLYEDREKKKQKAVLNKKYPVIDVPATGKQEWMGGAYVLCFVYSKYKGNVVLRGYMKEVEEYLKKNYTHYFCNMSLWSNGFNRDIWGFWKDGIGVFEPNRHSKSYKGKDKWKFQVRPYSHWWDDEDENKEKVEPLYFKRMPHRWIPEFDKF